ncbi:MAG: type II toxin-antitoxin system RelE/ParE family toxin [Pseudomonadota bacterium]
MSGQEYKAYLTKGAALDIEGIKTYTLENHGPQATDAYLALIEQAVQDLQDDPFRPGSRARDEVAPQARSYHIGLSRKRAESEIKSPRHFILYYTPGESRVEIDRIWHESRDLKR